MKRELTMSSYSIEVDLLSIMTLDNARENDNDWDNTLFNLLDKIKGVSRVDYNGHFGPYVWLSIEAEHDTPETWERIEKTITEFC